MSDLNLVTSVFDFLFLVVPILLPIGLVILLANIFLDVNRRKFIISQEHVLLEILPPQDIEKSPAAMELFLTALYNTGDAAHWHEKYFQGKVRAWFSLEIVSINGNVHFYIWTRQALRKNIESQLYAQFPGIEVVEVDDYTAGIEYDDSMEMFGAELKLAEPDPYPIKTYVDYGLDRETEEEIKVDPITPILEMMGSLDKGHQMWIQIIVRAHTKEDKDPSKWFGTTDAWKDTSKEEIQKIRDDSVIEVEEGDTKKKIPQMTKGQADRITALERSVSKLSFDTGVRMLYLSEKDVFDGSNIGAMLGSFKQYNSPDLNGFKISMTTSFKYPWQDRSGLKVHKMKEEILDTYKERDYFWRPYTKYFSWRPSKLIEREKFVLNTEELATIYHFPGRVAFTPTVDRVQSKKGTAPSDLPV
ncbi:hypothetical protein N9L18_00965 [Candidatus Pacebacteria bacterium]|nr:hypothetical protein [Candidatus Paceibacterota bacterium]